jgi:iron complex outermembrane receptor protein
MARPTRKPRQDRLCRWPARCAAGHLPVQCRSAGRPFTTFYSSSTYGIRRAIVGQNFRRPNSTNDIVSIYPDGYAPNYTLHESDFQTLWGLKGNLSGWKWDISSTYGENYARNGSTNTINASLGEDSPTSFSTFNAKFAQWTNNLDISKSFDIGLALPLQFSFGAEHRYERYTTTSGDPCPMPMAATATPAAPLPGNMPPWVPRARSR